MCRDGVPVAPTVKARRALHPAGHRGGGNSFKVSGGAGLGGWMFYYHTVAKLTWFQVGPQRWKMCPRASLSSECTSHTVMASPSAC